MTTTIDETLRTGTVVESGVSRAVGDLDKPHLCNCQCRACLQWSQTRGMANWKSYVCQKCRRLYEQDEYTFQKEPPDCLDCGVTCQKSRWWSQRETEDEDDSDFIDRKWTTT